MTDTTPQSAGETPAAPPDPWKGIQVYEDPADGCPMVQWEEVQAALATERQHHATREAEKDAEIQRVAKELMDALNEPMYAGSRDDWKHRAQYAEMLLTAARTEIARLTEERDDHSQCHDTACNGSRQKPRGARGVSCSCRGHDLAYQRAEAAEASLLALQQQMDDVRDVMAEVVERLTYGDASDAVGLVGDEVAADLRRCRDSLAAHLTGGPA